MGRTEQPIGKGHRTRGTSRSPPRAACRRCSPPRDARGRGSAGPAPPGRRPCVEIKFRRPAPSTRRRPRNSICPISTPSTRCCPQNCFPSMARVEVHAGLAAIEYPNSLVDVHAATDAWSRVCWPLGMTTILPVTRVTGRASSRPAIVRSRSGLRERRGELRGRPRGDEEHFRRGGLRAAGCPKEERRGCSSSAV